MVPVVPLPPALRVLLAGAARAPLIGQHHARRNALVAATAMAEARLRRTEVEEFRVANERRWAARTKAG